MALLHGLLLSAAPTRHLGGSVLLWSMVGALVVMAAGTASRHRAGWWLAVGGCSLLLLVELVLLLMMVASASFLAGVYGSFGTGAALIAVLAAALTIELVALLPAFQLAYLLRRRRAETA